ncbi:MAG: ROK family protein [Actinobacteria bacterium]|nr:MAG: ROK family protein [Actinomycetota bacterium]
MNYAIASDIGATNLRVGLVDTKGVLEQKQEYPTPQNDPNEVISLLYKAIERLDFNGKNIAGIGLGVGGLVNFEQGIVEYTPNFSFNNINLKDILTKRFKMPVYVDNDANAAALGEKIYGAGKGTKNLVCLTLGTGIGGGIIINDSLYRGTTSAAGEIGHMTIQTGGPLCGCGNDGDLEALAGGRALDKEAREVAQKHKDSLIFRLAEGKIERVNGALVTKAALQGDELSNELLKEHAKLLAVGLANIVNILDPDIIVLTGGMAEAGNLLLQPAKDILKKRVFADSTRVPKVVYGALGPDAGILGAAALVFEQSVK